MPRREWRWMFRAYLLWEGYRNPCRERRRAAVASYAVVARLSPAEWFEMWWVTR